MNIFKKNIEGPQVETIRYFDVGASRVLCQYPLGSELDQVGLRTFDISKEAYFGKIHNIFIISKDSSWLSYDCSHGPISLFNKEVNYVFFLADLKEGVNFSAQKCSKENKENENGKNDILFKAVNISAYLLLEQNEKEIAADILRSIGDDYLADKMHTALTPYEKHNVLKSLKRYVMQDCLDPITLKTNNVSLLDLLANLMESPNNFIYPFCGQKIKPNFEGFAPDPNYPVPFNRLEWNPEELTLSATIKFPGMFYLENPPLDIPSCIETFSNMTVDIIKYGVPCKKLAVSIDGKKGYLPLADYHMVSDFNIPQKLETLCDILHKRNCLLLKDKVFSYLLHKSRHLKQDEMVSGYLSRFGKLSPKQKKYLASKFLSKNGAQWTVQQNNKQSCCNFYEEEFETIFKSMDIVLNACFEGKTYNDFKDHMDMFTYGIIHELIQETFNTIFEESDNYFKTLTSLKEANWSDFLTHDSVIQKLRFLVTYASSKFSLFSKNEICAIKRNSFNFIFEQFVGDTPESSYAY